MSQSINRINSRKSRLAAILALLPLLFVLPQLPAIVFGRSGGRGSNEWLKRIEAAKQNLAKASQCVKTDRQSCLKFLDAAASEYRALAKMLAAGSDHDIPMVVQVADGMRRAGRPAEAIDLLLGYESTGDGDVLHLLADTLYDISDYQNSAVTYGRWIDLGCTGYLLSPGDHGLWARPLKGGRCSALPAELRARLEDLQEIAGGEPTSLPQHNRPAMRITSR